MKQSIISSYCSIILSIITLMLTSCSYDKGNSEIEQKTDNDIEISYNRNLNEQKDKKISNHAELDDEQLEVKRLYVKDIIAAEGYLEENGLKYPAENIIDGNINTAWALDHTGKNSIYAFDILFDKLVKIDYIKIINGYAKNENVFYNNARPTTLTLKTNDSVDRFHIQESLEWQIIETPKVGWTDEVKISISDITPGRKWPHVCFTEIEFYGREK